MPIMPMMNVYYLSGGSLEKILLKGVKNAWMNRFHNQLY